MEAYISRKTSALRDFFQVWTSGLFDRRYYEDNNPDVPRGIFASTRHYLRYGGQEGRAPHTLFDSRFYLEEYPDVCSAGINPLLHFVRFGRVERRHPNRYARIFDILNSPEKLRYRRLIDALVSARAQQGSDTVDINLSEIFGSAQPERRLIRRLIAEVFLCGEGIEVGALQDPLPAPPDALVQYVDRFSKQDLLNQYPELRGAPLVDVDIVDNGEQLFSLKSNSQDFVVANHFVEHTQDPIATLKNFCRVVKSGGYLYIAVPDQTSTFDKDRKPTSLEHLIEDHRSGPAASRHGHFLEWVTLCEPHFGRTYEGEAVAKRVKELEDKDYSIHFHCWRPEDFKAFLEYCSREERVGLEVPLFVRCPGEMVVVLRVSR